MGTAPSDRQYPAMPDPVRVVGRSVAMLRRLGLSEGPALDVIVVVASRAYHLASEQSPGFRLWLTDIMDTAINRQSSLSKSRADREGNDHANG